MCITLKPARLNNTKILSIKLPNGNHFIGYSNKVQNLSGKPNAMVLPIPGTAKPEFFYDTTKYKNFLNEIANATKPRSRGLMKGVSSKSLSYDKFEVGMYTVGLSDSFDGAAFINSLPEEKRPEFSEEMGEFFRVKYKGWSFAVCVFDTTKTIDAQPIAFEYKPFDDVLYFPTMDSHDGHAPKPERVDTDHVFLFEDTINGLNKLTLKGAPDFLQGRAYHQLTSEGYAFNGDTFIYNTNLPELVRNF